LADPRASQAPGRRLAAPRQARMSLDARLSEGLAALGLDLTEEVTRRLIAHLDLVAKWNRVHNLTAVREPGQMIPLHLLDSLTLPPRLDDARTLVDVGTGAGFPGIPIAIARPDLRVTLLDASHKKCAFLEQARMELSLGNVEVVCERVER